MQEEHLTVWQKDSDNNDDFANFTYRHQTNPGTFEYHQK